MQGDGVFVSTSVPSLIELWPGEKPNGRAQRFATIINLSIIFFAIVHRRRRTLGLNFLLLGVDPLKTPTYRKDVKQ
jgi:hypothetical protein